MALIIGNRPSPIVRVGTVDVAKIYKGLGLIWQSDLPAGTVLLEHRNGVERTYSQFELMLPTEQEVEIVIVGGGAALGGGQADV